MILQALNGYYERLQNDSHAQVAPFGFSLQKIAYGVTLNDDGTFGDNCIEDLRQQEGKKLVAQSLRVCGGAKPPGSGINPCFLWDNPTYMLGYKPDDPNPERTLECFEAFRQRHLDVEEEVNDSAFSAVCRFLERWDPVRAADYETLVEIATGFGVFRIRGAKQFVHERAAIVDWWRSQLQQEDETSESAEMGQCLVTGERASIARLHEPKIKGVWGGQSSGAAMVSFNFAASESYGKVKEQGLNSPVSEKAAFQYCTALNLLLADKRHRVQIGDATAVFWTEEPTPAENILGIVFGNKPSEDEETVSRVEKTLSAIAQGKYPGEFGERDTPFYILGLSPNAARISVRFWEVSTLGKLMEHLHQHFEDLQISGFDSDPEYPAIWQLLRQTSRESKDIPPLLSGALARSIVSGTAYPDIFYTSVLRRIRADREIWYLRAACLKAVINRRIRKGDLATEAVSEFLDERRIEPSYHIGRLFQLLENVQTVANEGLETTIRHRYLSSAMQSPATVMPRLLSLYHHHIRKLPNEDEKAPWKTRPTCERRINGIINCISEFPRRVSIIEQGLFAIGYHHERTRHATISSPSNAKE